MKFQDLTGQKFNMLTVIERAPNVGHNTAWYCRCDCGKITKVIWITLMIKIILSQENTQA